MIKNVSILFDINMFMKKNNISKFEYCFGCGVCAVACPKKIIQIKTNGIGFYVHTLKTKTYVLTVVYVRKSVLSLIMI